MRKLNLIPAKTCFYCMNYVLIKISIYINTYFYFFFRAYNVTDQWKYHEKYQKPSFTTHRFTLALILRLCKTHLIISGILELFRVFFLLMGPQVLRQLLNILEHSHESKWHGFEYCLLLVAVGLFGNLNIFFIIIITL